jgi:ribonuclease T1
MRFLQLICALFLSLLLFQSCNSALNVDDDYNKGYKQGYQDGINAANKSQHSAQTEQDDPNTINVQPSNDDRSTNANIPQKVYQTLKYVQQNNRAPDGYVGGRHFGNFEKRLPERDAAGDKIDYKEYDVNPKVEGKNRGAQRLVIGSDGSAWYTNNHYESFEEVK